MRFLSRDVAHMTEMITARPNKDTARLSRVLSLLSGLAKAPMIITPTTRVAPSGIFNFSGTMVATFTPVLFHVQRIGFVTTVIGTWKKIRRRVMPR